MSAMENDRLATERGSPDRYFHCEDSRGRFIAGQAWNSPGLISQEPLVQIQPPRSLVAQLAESSVL